MTTLFRAAGAAPSQGGLSQNDYLSLQFPNAQLLPPPPTSAAPSPTNIGAYERWLREQQQAAALAQQQYQQSIEQARREAQRAHQQLQAQYERDRKELQAQFSFAETAAEKQQLARALATLNQQRAEAVKAIATGFNNARADITSRAAEVAGYTPEQAKAVGDLYREGAEAVRGAAGQAADAANVKGLGVNVGGTGNAAIDELAASVSAAGVREEALEGRLGQITQDDLRWLADTLSGESEAHQADARRLADSMVGAYQLSHDQRVADRIAGERAQYANLLAGLQSDYRNRGFQLQDSDLALLQQLAQMQHQTALSAGDRATQAQAALQQQQFQAQQAAADRALQVAQMRPQQQPHPNTLAGALFALDTAKTFGPSSYPTLQQHGFGGAIAPLVQQGQQQVAQGYGNLFGSIADRVLAPLGGLFRR